MNKDDIIRMAVEAGGFIPEWRGIWELSGDALERFAALVAAEKEQQVIRDGWRQCAKGQRTTQFCGLLDAAVKAEREKLTQAAMSAAKIAIEEAMKLEREACAEIAEAYEPRCDVCPKGVANAIRARGET